MTNRLWPYLRLKAASDEELKEKYRQVFIETYVRDASGKEIRLFDWHGVRVRFHEGNFDHAFSESSNYRFRDGVHDLPLSKQRARRILWIKEVLTADQGTIEVRNQYRSSKRRRVLLVVEERYVVVLEYRLDRKEYQFISAYSADKGGLARIKREGGWVETKKAPVLTATEAKPKSKALGKG